MCCTMQSQNHRNGVLKGSLDIVSYFSVFCDISPNDAVPDSDSDHTSVS